MGKYCDITGLEFMRGVGGNLTQNDVMFEAKLQDFEGHRRSDAE
jgi:hypothetical protein